ncbi:hypothetical protein [Nocardioides currus]|uniref:Uncharacterized protein n=1 Tax=Nocardioides currus TaxID=2133958 RepID=A0A2R7Z187_9ACTN|nr:hypothetical protein [Nocardioides currus]PUA82382.1 hypothetical protein C7S10_01130 [Nocardioides currus]
MSPFPTARATRPDTRTTTRSLSRSAQALTDVLGRSEVAVPGLLGGLDLTGSERTWQRLPVDAGADVEL